MPISLSCFNRPVAVSCLPTAAIAVKDLRCSLVDQLKAVANTSDYPKDIVAGFSEVQSALKAGNYSKANKRVVQIKTHAALYENMQKGKMAAIVSQPLRATVERLETLATGVCGVYAEAQRLETALDVSGEEKQEMASLGRIIKTPADIMIKEFNKGRPITDQIDWLKSISAKLQNHELGIYLSADSRKVVADCIDGLVEAIKRAGQPAATPA